MAQKNIATKYANAVRASFDIPGSEFRMQCFNREGNVWFGSMQCYQMVHTAVWMYEADLSVDRQTEHADIPTEIWTLSVQWTLERSGKSGADISTDPYKQTKITASVSPRAPVLAELKDPHSPSLSNCQNLKLDFFVGISVAGSSSVSKGNGFYKNGTWQCVPAQGAFSVSVSPFHYNNSPKDGVKWLLDMVLSNSKSTVQNVAPERSNGLCGKLSGVLRSSSFTDCVLISSDNKEFPAHRVILAAQSNVFAAMFTNEMSEKSTGICRITDIDSDNLQIVLEFLYGRTVSDGIKKNVEDMVAVANKYDLDDLRTVCENLMIDNLNSENAVRYLGLSVNYGLGGLMKKAAKIVAE